MNYDECAAMLLAGGEGRRLGVFTRSKAKPAVHFGGAFRIIDFALSNCTYSGIRQVGVMTQYKAASLHRHIGAGRVWSEHGNGVDLLPPGEGAYTGTADAVRQNLAFLDRHRPDHVLILSADHIYRMDYRKMLERHRQTGADATIAVTPVAWEEAHRFGIMCTGEDGQVTTFVEKPARPSSNLASMGIYIFKRSYLKQILESDARRLDSSHDFGKDVIPAMLGQGAKLQTYAYEGYWRDVGTVESLWEAHMDLIGDKPKFSCASRGWSVRTPASPSGSSYVDPAASVSRSLLAGSCTIYGTVEQSVVSAGVIVGQGSTLRRSVVMPNARIGRNVSICNAMIGEGAVIEDGVTIGSVSARTVEVVGDAEVVRKQGAFQPGIYITPGAFAMEGVSVR
ncbi:Glucose-1-phosphate adenylyltransferase [Paenibacillus solanacearum]|uniref:Glucose-1-phosphate adenylyltransferase n=1 Tax=Paenibacillus solanacearum TaxID=2048548 RepID=A0A916NR11_9BACL|nr:sugar phosphate nucleotidyltransferase [Paenibacillus solanacearum]CAG7644011.1 Glucose-1-phosphate adenylyltransferase [Paenibacillus solanacearum]